ncbi:MAG: hypothetical protein KI788_01385 [Mameliella sp.]|nr:hypothetical protein [Mameliella sp.]
MAKRLDPRRLRAVLTYDVRELARALGVTPGTVRAMIRRGMPTLAGQRPTLILGQAAREFIEHERVEAKKPLAPDQLYCMSCKAPARPWGMLVDLVGTARSPRLVGICEDCEGRCSRVVSAARLPDLRKIFDICEDGGAAP